ncbi:hypothetical protein ACFE04_030347 [Oxalis oulophora]
MVIDDDASSGNSSRLRRSARQTSLTSQSCREFKRLDEKQTLCVPTPPAKKKSVRLENRLSAMSSSMTVNAVPVPVLPKTSFSLAPNLHNTQAFAPHLRNMPHVRAPHLRNMPPEPG